MNRTIVVIAAFLAFLPYGAESMWAQSPVERMTEFLRSQIGLDDEELRRVRAGEVYTKVLDTDEDTEVAIFGVVRVHVPVDYFVAWHEDIEHFESGDAVLAIRKIGTPPRIEDFAALELSDEDMEALSKCRLGDCEVKVTENILGRLHIEIDWSSPGAKEAATRLLHQMALEGVEEYVKEGDASLGAYRDKKRPSFIEEEFDALLASSPYLMEYVPELHRYLDDYPHAELPGVNEFLYWSTVKFGLKPTTRVNHVVFYRRPNGSVAIASKMLYASHYFHTALELKYVIPDTSDSSTEGFYLLSFSRSRSDGLTGMFGGLVRRRAQSGALDGLASALASLKRLAEQGYGGAAPP
ncbi:MAG TPA: hypothetical protein VEK15_28725 [Vicinamibacteria bacterium]|nr:hypothetical protein [Vicinamibacteria bacterium]